MGVERVTTRDTDKHWWNKKEEEEPKTITKRDNKSGRLNVRPIKAFASSQSGKGKQIKLLQSVVDWVFGQHFSLVIQITIGKEL